MEVSEGENALFSEEPSPTQKMWTDDETEDEGTGEGFKDEETLFPKSVDDFGFNSDSSWDGDEADLAVDFDVIKKMSCAERSRMFKLRTNLDQLDSLHKQKEYEVLKARAALFRLRALQRRLCVELQGEEDLESQIELVLGENEYELCQVEVEQGRFSSLRREVQRDEEESETQRGWEANQRLQKEEAAMRRAELRKQLDRKKQMNSFKEQEVQHRKAVEDAVKNHKKAVRFLKETTSRIHQKETEKELRSREEMERRTQAVLSLKSKITATKENIRAMQAHDQAKAAVQKEEERRIRESVRREGGNVTKYMYQQKRLQEFERQKQAFEEQKKSRKVEILSKILQEEAQMEKRKKLLPDLFPKMQKSQDFMPESGKPSDKLLQYLEMTYGEADDENYRPNWRSPSPMSEDGVPISGKGSSGPDLSPGSQDYTEDGDSKEEAEESLAQPEFTGLWDQKHKTYKIPQDETRPRPITTNKMEQEILARTLEKHRSGIIRKQVVVGKEFKGCPFYSKPDVIHFKDFEVGKTYKKKVMLTNSTYTINFCKLVGVSEHLRDFIYLHFDPPGQVSAGMACDLGVTFKPMINEDLFGEVTFLTQTGPFAVPLKCTIKKCELAVDSSLIDFGTHVVGETISRTITLSNRGALGTKFNLVTSASSSAVRLTPEPSPLTPRDSPHADVVSEAKGSTTQDSGESCKEQSEGPDHSSETRSHKASKEKYASLSSSEQTPLVPKQQNQDMAVASDLMSTTGSRAELLESSAQELLETSEIKPGEVTEGELKPFGFVKLQIMFTPTIPGEVQMDFDIKFSDPNSQSIPVRVRGVAIDVPVWVSKPNVDLKICMYDRLYQDSIPVHSRVNTAVRATFEVCKELKNHMELLPKSGYIQAQSTFNVQLKFLPRLSLMEDAGGYFDKETGVLEVPMTIHVADQTRPLLFAVHAVVTASDLEFDRKEVDFGHCSIHESVQTSVHLTNKSLLPQEFGFVGIPKYVDVQPNDGFGILLPMETVEIDIIFSAKKAKEYSFELTCKSGINRDFKLSCKAVGVHPPLELSHSLVQFGATAVNDKSTATLYVVNSHTSRNEFTHPVPRIGKGEIAPVGPTSFEFVYPEDSDITITPAVGTVLPGKSCLVQVCFRPSLYKQQIQEEAVHMLCRAEETRLLLQDKKEKEATNAKKAEMDAMSKKEPPSASKGKKKQKQASAKQTASEKNTRICDTPRANSNENRSPFNPPKPGDIPPDSDSFAAAQASLIRSFKGSFKRYIIPCFVASGKSANRNDPGHLQYSPHNTLYLELHCPAVVPPLVVLSDHGRSTVNFKEVAAGQTVVKRVTVQNISHETLELGSTLLDPNGPFKLMNALRPLQPGATHTLLVSFSPAEDKKFYETLEIRTSNMTLCLNLSGIGIYPSVTCSAEGGIMDFGYVLANESSTSVFKLQNTSSIPVNYNLKQDSVSVKKHKDQQGLPSFLSPNKEPQSLVGTQNNSGLSVFCVSPLEGAINPGTSQDITVTFQPDHESLYYSDRLMVEIVNKEVAHVIQLKGSSRIHTMFVDGGDPLDVPIESLADLPAKEDPEGNELVELMKPVLLTLKAACSENTLTPAVRELQVGCIRSTQPLAKKNVEFSLDNLNSLQQKGFNVDPGKGAVDPGQKKSITVTWVPPSGHDVTQPVSIATQLTLKGDVTEIYKLTLLALVSS
ncbi:cilia- and flagella-associated protein 74-like isoform X2 [Polyodon spathula]|uniref:cilia- and flagella-associated protein 74-like isoform X2 n=1 Tax=Polyodon spathula TaxID=7913 RepID=UPI001B7E905E|nr:cilia- and flagella-associated protein 74-like isoform X2 [Polyodon spathula]